jgi:hypothetical protein
LRALGPASLSRTLGRCLAQILSHLSLSLFRQPYPSVTRLGLRSDAAHPRRCLSPPPPPLSRAALVRRLEHGPPQSTASGHPSRLRCLLELGLLCPSAAAPTLPVAPLTSASPIVKNHQSVPLAVRPVRHSCAAACRQPPVWPSAFTSRRHAALLLAGRPEVPIEARGEDSVLLMLHLR